MFTTVKHWTVTFERGSKSCQDQDITGRPNDVTTSENPKKIHQAVLDYRQLKVHELADIGISKSPHMICKFGYEKVVCKMVAAFVDTNSVARFLRNKTEFSRRFTTMDETCVYHLALEAKNNQNSELKRDNRLQRGRKAFHRFPDLCSHSD